MKRRNVNKKSFKRSFKKGANRTKSINVNTAPRRGGIRL